MGFAGASPAFRLPRGWKTSPESSLPHPRARNLPIALVPGIFYNLCDCLSILSQAHASLGH